jgi:hypothetical protein
MPKSKASATKRKAAVAKRPSPKAAVKTRKVKLYAPVSVPQITRGEKHAERHYVADPDGAIRVPSNEVSDFLAMGCTREPQGAPEVVNHVEPKAGR